MGTITIRNLPDEVHNSLKQLAIQNNRSAEAEARNILAAAVGEAFGGGLGTIIRKTWGANLGGEFEPVRSKEGPREVSFE